MSIISKTYSVGGDGGSGSGINGSPNTGNGGAGTKIGGSGAVLIYVPIGKTFNLISGTVVTYSVAGYDSIKEFVTSGQFSLS